MATNLVTGGRITGRATSQPQPQLAVPSIQYAQSKAPFTYRHRNLLSSLGMAVALTAFILLVIANNTIGAHINTVKVLSENANMLRVQDVYTGQDTETVRLFLGIGIFVAAAVFVFMAFWLTAQWISDSEGVVLFLPVIAGVALLATAFFTVIGTAPGTTNAGAVYDAGSNWLELKHNIPYDVRNYMNSLSSNDNTSNSFANNVTVIDENGGKHILTIAVGGANQDIFTMHLKDATS